jgi:hypothetical protein
MTTGRIPSVEGGIQPTIIDAAGDLIYGASNDTPARLAIGTAGQLLTVNSGATAPEWVTPTGGGANWTLLNSGGTSLTGSAVTISGISGADKILVLIGEASSSAQSFYTITVNSLTTSIYYRFGININPQDPISFNAFNNINSSAASSISMGQMSTNAASVVTAALSISGANSSGVKVISGVGGGNSASGTAGQALPTFQGYIDTTAAITSVTITSGVGTFDAGTVFVFTSA